jgi:heme A synthase
MVVGATLAVGFTALNYLWSDGRRPEAPVWLLLLVFLVVGLCGAVGGATYHATEGLRARGGWRRRLADAATLLAFGMLALAVLVVALAWQSRTS